MSIANSNYTNTDHIENPTINSSTRLGSNQGWEKDRTIQIRINNNDTPEQNKRAVLNRNKSE